MSNDNMSIWVMELQGTSEVNVATSESSIIEFVFCGGGITTLRPTTEKTTLVDADEVNGNNSATLFTTIRTTWLNVKAFLKTYFDNLYEEKNSNIQSHISSTSNPHSVTAAQVGSPLIPILVSHTLVIPFNNICTTITSSQCILNDEYTINSTGAIDGYGATVVRTGDGTHSPTFTGFTEYPNSKDFKTTLNAVNVITFWKQDTYYFYLINNE